MAEKRRRQRNEDFIIVETNAKLSNLDAKLMEDGIHSDNFGVEFEEGWEKYVLRWQSLFPKITPTRFQNTETMTGLGIEADLRRMFRLRNMEEFFDKRPPTYQALTAEFLSTLQVKKNRNGYPISIPFQLDNQWRSKVLVDTLNGYMGCPSFHFHNHFYAGGSFNQQNWWNKLVNNGTELPDYIPSASKGTAIRNPVMRYLEKIVSNIVLGRYEGGSVGEKQSYLMYCLYNELNVNMAAYFVQHAERVAKRQASQGVMIGGIVTMIAEGLGINLRGREDRMTSEGLNYQQLIRMEFLALVGQTYCLR